MLKLADDGAPPPPALFTLRLAARWGDLDADGRVNNVTILRYVEEARMQLAARLALAREAPGMMPVVASLGCVYRAPVGYPCELDIRVGCGHVGRSSVGLTFEIADAGSGAAYASACVTWVWVDKVSERPVEMPAALRQFCLNHST
ncbi:MULTISPECIES: acyl-CoA thioesterase [Cupriavidus]|uniref:acyl-CoA thioesterase n=1 Tax=Cupriavidus TaxID=106589 RepID=UPI000372B84D|nr:MULTISPECIES: acyl-CoA thioesterase [Cupriavidus]